MMFNQSKQFPAGMAGGDQQAGGAGGMFARLLGRNPMEGMGQGPMPPGMGGAQPAATMPAGQPAGVPGAQGADIGALLRHLLQARQQQGGVPPWLMQMMGRGQG